MRQASSHDREIDNELLKFSQDLVRIRSYSGQEERIIRHIAEKMKDLGYDEVTIDGFGNVVGRIGSGGRILMFDSHVDTVAVNDEEAWEHPPFGGDIVDGYLWGRGSVDMKSGAAASLYAAAVAKRKGLTSGKTLYVSCSTLEEDCDGENLRHLFNECSIRPDYMVICEPSDNVITTGHKGKAQIVIRTKGLSSHAAAPEKGENAIYEMADIIRRVELTNRELMKGEGRHGTLAMTRIASTSASLNAVPSECEVYLDRRLAVGETEESLRREMDGIIEGRNATWEIGALERKTWTGLELRYLPFHLAWQIDPGHELMRLFKRAHRETFGQDPERFDFWDFSTNAVSSIRLGIPTIGFGPGEYKLAHMRDERCKTSQISDACSLYTQVIALL